MFRLDEVSNYKNILIEGEITLPPHAYKSMFCRCFSMFCRGEAGNTETYSPRPPCVPIVNWPMIVRGLGDDLVVGGC